MRSVFHVMDIMNIALVLPIVTIALFTIQIWFRKAIIVVRKRRKLDAMDWMILGVTIFIVGSIFNAVFWGTHFFTDFIGYKKGTQTTYFLGPKINVITRLIPYFVAEVCLAQAAYQFSIKQGITPRTLAILGLAWTFGIAVALGVWSYMTGHWPQ